ncbi:MFS transporter [Limnochorda pilosa]|uniref:MFS transporter n=1 Tax=Limnochorda pilosa TaxID=1555112 RepID=A0A0K2SGV6_LIMPI|nr:MFS transporter [Limnochorda pilosa]BAS26343.1 hypothetical protein LIP_0486 [Limnochorda pilosa]
MTQAQQGKYPTPEGWYTIIRLPGFGQLWGIHLLTSVAGQFHILALTWIAIELTGSEAAAGALLMMSAIPRAILLPVGGAIADRSPATKVLTWTLSVLAVLAGLLGTVLSLARPSVSQIGLLVSVFGIAVAMYSPAAFAAVAPIAGRENLQTANALIQFTTQAGPFLGSLAATAAFATVGLRASYLVVACLLGIATLLAANLGRFDTSYADQHPPTSSEDDMVGAQAKGRARFGSIMRSVEVILLLLTSAAINLSVVGPLQVGLAGLVRNGSGTGPEMHGVFVAVFGLGSLLGSAVPALVLGKTGTDRRIYRWLTVLGALWVFVGKDTGAVTTGALLFGSGVCVAVVSVLVISRIQGVVPAAVLGRAMGILLVASTGLQPLSLLLAGYGSEWIGPSRLFLISGVFAAAVGLACQAISIRTDAKMKASSREGAES